MGCGGRQRGPAVAAAVATAHDERGGSASGSEASGHGHACLPTSRMPATSLGGLAIECQVPGWLWLPCAAGDSKRVLVLSGLREADHGAREASVSMGSAAQCTAAAQASLAITNSRSLLKLMPIELRCHQTISSSGVSCRPCLLLPSIEVFSSPLRQVARGLKCQLQPQAFQ